MDDIQGLDRTALDRARVSRDPRFDGKFFIAVKTTGIYCRPICPAPSPKGTNIVYYASAAAAAEAGFRPCLRCRPEAAPGTPAWLGTSAVVRRALRMIQDGELDRISVDALADKIGIGSRHLHRLFTQHVGASPIAVAQTRRLHFAKRLLDETQLPITQIALAAGFGSLRRFNDAFQKTYQRSPRDLRRSRRPASAADGNEVILRLAYRPPYDWQHVRDFLATRAIPGVERINDDGYARTVATENGHATVAVRALDGTDALELRVSGAAPAALFQISSTARRMFDLAADPSRIAATFRGDSLLAPLAKVRPGLRIPGAWDPFECAVRAVLGQQVSVAAARTLAARLVNRVGRRVSDEAELSHLFPSPAELAAANLDGLGITGARIKALHALSRAVADGQVDFQHPAEEVIRALTALPGFGAWTAQYIALRALGEPDGFPTGDLVLRRLASDDETPLSIRALEARAEHWRPWRGYAVMHLWKAAGEKKR
ncbi:AraC family transcriptional regulator of adaptative response / DNA-3-methyladenine glycosylase II [Povalibacter uvarum]|uniref:DNA-3-methyladenine glycosylase II n=1 Tax=Povalibacter uvarum TaxID=732238 RepID=A0A841HMX7_9GAMM|nr:DNA-3-methyladenine glycosylase 2 [Povalibacter uvarum]MBB6094477.1 AraC family transcriptional regulator of adaptative response / DNA-3-methyladenine glycosylase II [Povalibacter uvarum]